MLAYIAFALWCFTVALAGGLVGLVLGNLRLPLVVLLAASPAVGAGTNLGISAVAAATAAVAHVRAGRINWRLFVWMAPASIVGAVGGALLSGALPSRALLLAIAAVLAYSGLDLLRRRPPARAEPPRPKVGAAVVTGGAIGLLGGFVGLILGSLRMPALLRVVGEAPAPAVGTNLAVGFCVGVAGALAHLPSAVPDWGLLAIGAAASLPGALLGARLTGRLSEPQLIRAIAVILVVVAVVIAVQALA